MAYTRCGIALPKTHTATKIDVAKTPLASFQSNVSGLYIPEIIAYIQATQSGSGDPSQINPRAISGVSSVDTTVCGKNLFNGTNVINAYFSSNSTITVSGATRLVYARCKANATYTVSKTAGTRFGVAYSSELPDVGLQCSGYTVDNTASSITITTGADAKYICAYVYHSSYDSGTAQDMLDSVQIEESNTATAYEAYTGQTATTNLGGTYYGGYVNVPTGLLTVTHLGVDMGSLRWTYIASDDYFNVIESRIKSDTPPEVMCEQFAYRGRASASTMSTAPTGSIYYFTNALRVKDTRFTDANTFITAVTGQLVMFELKETAYETVQLTPAQIEQLLGQNNVFCSSGDVAMKYWKVD